MSDETLTEAELEFDRIVQQQRAKGRKTYGSGLNWSDGKDGPYDWRQMAMEEAVDLAQYLCAELLRTRFEVAALKRALGERDSTGTGTALTLSQYQFEALRTAPNVGEDVTTQDYAVLALGLAGESGEVVELVKKYLGHGHDFSRDKMAKELGDVLWYLATLADASGLDLADVAQRNIDKLRARYPNGFSYEASRNRAE